jgi:hypothetical protein
MRSRGRPRERPRIRARRSLAPQGEIRVAARNEVFASTTPSSSSAPSGERCVRRRSGRRFSYSSTSTLTPSTRRASGTCASSTALAPSRLGRLSRCHSTSARRVLPAGPRFVTESARRGGASHRPVRPMLGLRSIAPSRARSRQTLVWVALLEETMESLGPPELAQMACGLGARLTEAAGGGTAA